MNKKQQKHELFVTFSAHMQGSKNRRQPAPVKKKKKVVKVSFTMRYQQLMNTIREKVQLQFQQIGHLVLSWKLRH